MGFLFGGLTQDTSAAQAGVQAQQAALEQARQQQMGLAQALQQQYSGQGPNAALGLMQRGSEEAIRRSAGALASQRGINPALAQRLAAQQAAEAGQQAAQSGAILQAQQSQQALGQLGNVYGQMGQQAVGAMGISQQALSEQQRANQQVQGQLAGGLLSGVGALGAAYLGRAHGGKIPGKATVPGDHPANDTVPAMLSPGEIVIPRTKAEDPKLAKQFIDHVMKNKGGKVESKKEVTYADVLAAQQELQKMIASLKG